ncbi:three-Cys-motif partner protein TcmP [Thermogemmatispora onikobensis]|uniref:three-Cys-motif partner protein TcmP n=1 Tax=Thermogemmatispora onikobensis TaxID=732234 RepID=UPI0008528F60|nr:three-Cys-motif partner protein TcmP [Thermogemmatispora onikobensis]
MAPQSVIWKLDDHTRAKHVILRKYLDAWLPILIREGRSGLLIDGFAGPGEYVGGEIGSPLIMISAYQQHRAASLQRGTVKFLFVELDPKRAAHLRQKLQAHLQYQPLPSTATYEVYTGRFVDAMTSLLASGCRRYDAMFVFIDPFGFSHAPMDVIRNLMACPRCEVLITFMHEEINRFLEADYRTKQQHYDSLFGTTAWQTITLDAPDVQTRQRRLHDLYRQQLLTVAGARYVRSFCMRNSRNTTDYFLFFATKHRRGMKEMKRAMWKVDPTGNFVFSDCTGMGQGFLLHNDDPAILAKEIYDHFRGKRVTVDDIEEFVIADTAFFKYKSSLSLLEEKGKIVVYGSEGRRKGTYSDLTMPVLFS